MKHLLINPYSQLQEWCKDYFPDRSLGMMPVGGRCAAEYFIDLALRCEAETLLLLGPTYNEHLAEHLYEYQHGELALDYRKGGGHDTVKHLLEVYSKECGNDCLILHGMLMPKSHTLAELMDSFVPCDDDGAAYRCSSCVFCPFRDRRNARSRECRARRNPSNRRRQS